MQHVLDTGEPVLHSPVPTRAGEVGSWRVSYFRLPLPGGKRGLGIVGAEITDLKNAEAALREADRRKDEFLAVLSHELRNPLAPISNSIFLLEKLPSDSAQAIRARAIVRRQAEHLTRLVDDLLDVTRISRGKVQLQRQVVDIRDLVRRTCEDHRSTFEQGRIDFTLDCPVAPLLANVDPTRIAQVLGNLLSNASKFTPPGGAVTVRVRRREQIAELTVHDTGIGIEPEQLGRMFEPFTQEARGLAQARGGLGLGLALSKGLVELHGGSVAAHSGGAGDGAEFLVRLPLAAQAPRPSSPTPPAQAKSTRRRVLLIDDNADAARTLADVLELLGHEVSIAADGASGIALARETRPDVVICDLGLPDVSGYDVARTLRSDDALRSTRLIALSGYGQPEDKRRAKDAGFEEHFTRPAPVEDLAATLARG